MKRYLLLGFLFTALLVLVPAPEPVEAIGGICYHCVVHTWEFPDGTSETLEWCMLLGGDGGTGCYEVNNGLGCVLLFPTGCNGSEPPPE